jgi:hypothetical protein
MVEKNSNIKVPIGDLLVEAGLLPNAQLETVIAAPRATNAPLGKVLLENGLVSEVELNAALLAQNLIRERLIAPAKAVAVLALVRSNGLSFLENLYAVGCDIEVINFSRSLGKLFVDAKIIEDHALNKAMETSILSGLPIVRVLVLQKQVTEIVAYAGLTAKLLYKEKKIGYDQAVGALKLSHMHGDPVEDILEFGGFKRYRSASGIRLGELLVLSELINELDLLSCVERSMSEAKPIGVVLVEEGIIGEVLVASALRAQSYIAQGVLETLRACQLLKQCARTGRPMEFTAQELAQLKPVPLVANEGAQGLSYILEITGLLTDDDLTAIARVEKEDRPNLETFVLSRGFIDEPMLQAIKIGGDLIESGRINAEQLVFAIHIWLWRGGQFGETLKMLGWEP